MRLGWHESRCKQCRRVTSLLLPEMYSGWSVLRSKGVIELTVQLQEYLHIHTLNIKVLYQIVAPKPVGKPHCWLTNKLWSCIFAPVPRHLVTSPYRLCRMLFEIFIRGKQAGEGIAWIIASHFDAERALFILQSPSVCTVTARASTKPPQALHKLQLRFKTSTGTTMLCSCIVQFI